MFGPKVILWASMKGVVTFLQIVGMILINIEIEYTMLDTPLKICEKQPHIF